MPSSEEIISLSERVRSGVTRRGSPNNNITTPTWVKLALPLWVDSQFIGICLFGRRDPDDHYSDLEIKTLKTIMNQTALALVNIDQARQLHALYQNDMERQEKERSRLARELHDNVLNKMALFAHTTNDEDNEGGFSEILGSSVAEIREIIHNLRPSMLNFGLMPAINELVDELVTAKGFCR
jgi:signal transduction histidine kinase